MPKYRPVELNFLQLEPTLKCIKFKIAYLKYRGLFQIVFHWCTELWVPLPQLQFSLTQPRASVIQKLQTLRDLQKEDDAVARTDLRWMKSMILVQVQTNYGHQQYQPCLSTCISSITAFVPKWSVQNQKH